MPFDLQGHRGARGLLPENTLPGFRKALELGVVTLEMDVVVSKDREVVVSHDPWMSGTVCSLPSGAPVPVEDERDYRIYGMSYSEVKQFDCGRRRHPAFPRQQPQAAVKPLLRDVIRHAEMHAASLQRPQPFYNIETKSDPAWEGTFHPDPERFTRLVFDVLAEQDVLERSILQSFDGRTLQVGRTLSDRWRLSLLTTDGLDLDVHVEMLGFVPDIYSPDYHFVDAAIVGEAHDHGMAVLPWTVNTMEEMQHLQSLGVDGVITDYPDVGRSLMNADPEA